MKAILTVIFIIFIGVAAQAQNSTKQIKVETITMEIEMNFEAVTSKKDTSVARLYMFKNSLVKKELSFTTKNDKAKLA